MLPRRLPQGRLRPRSTPLLHPTVPTTSAAILRTSLPPTVTPSAFPPTTTTTTITQTRPSSSSSNSRWKTRQSSDFYARSARTAQLRSRAAFKLLEINKKHRIFRPGQGQVVVDLGFAPGSWSQVALDCTKPDGKVVGIDIIPAQPPRGVSAIQGNFLTEGVRGLVKGWLKEEEGRKRMERLKREREREEMERLKREREEREAREAQEAQEAEAGEVEERGEVREGEVETQAKKDDPRVEEVVEGMENLEIAEKHRRQQKQAEEKAIVEDRPSYIELERMAVREAQLQQEPEISEQPDEEESRVQATTTADAETEKKTNGEKALEGLEDEQQEQQQQQEPKKKKQPEQMRLVDVVLSDMSEPWPQTSGFSIKTLSNPYDRMMNTSGISFKDHAGSMDLCYAALSFANDTLKPGGHFVCKFYQGSEDKKLEKMLRKLFTKVFREKPDSSRSESKEAYFVALHRKGDVILEDIPL